MKYLWGLFYCEKYEGQYLEPPLYRLKKDALEQRKIKNKELRDSHYRGEEILMKLHGYKKPKPFPRNYEWYEVQRLEIKEI